MTDVNKQRRLLEELRSDLIGKFHTLPFTIYSDDTIEDLLKAQPQSIEELVTVKGFPKDGKRVKGFGESVVKIFTDPDAIGNFEITGNDDSISIGITLKNMEVF